MHTLFRLLFLALACLSLNPLSLFAARGDAQVAFEGKSIDQMVAEYMKEHDVPGMTLAIVQAPYITRVVGYGYAVKETKQLASLNTIFNIGEMRDAFTAVAIMQLVEAGKLKLDEPIENYLVALKTEPSTYSIRDLLRRAHGPNDYATLQQLIEKISGQSYQSFLRAGQLDRLGLKHTFFGSELSQVVSEPVKPAGKHSAFLKNPVLINPTETAFGTDKNSHSILRKEELAALYSSAEDISIWDIGLAGEILIKSPELRAILYAPAPAKNGTALGSNGPWIFPGRPGLMLITGNRAGCSSFLSRYTKSDELLCVTLLANKEGLDLAPLAKRIAAAFDARLINTGVPEKK